MSLMSKVPCENEVHVGVLLKRVLMEIIYFKRISVMAAVMNVHEGVKKQKHFNNLIIPFSFNQFSFNIFRIFTFQK